jgi:hypothetical protein
MNITFASLKTTGKVETVWAVISMGQPSDKSLLTRFSSIKFTDYIIVWGKRGGKLRSIRVMNDYVSTVNDSAYEIKEKGIPTRASWIVRTGYCGEAIQRIHKKLKAGYRPVRAENLADVYPEFEKDLAKINFWEQFKT